MAKYKGGYQIISLLGVLVSASLSSTINAKEMLTKIKGSNLKRIVLTDLVVDGEKKNDIEVQYELDETNKKLTLNGVYGYKIEIDYSTSVTSAGIVGALMPDEVGTKLYKHEFSFGSGATVTLINSSNENITKLTDNIYNTALSCKISGGLHQGKVILAHKTLYTGTGGYNGFGFFTALYSVSENVVTQTLEFISHDASDLSDTVTAL